jgi:coenzyme F420-reducing hydrogenase delta subunit
VAFACARSAGPALRSAAANGQRWPAHLNLLEVPCAGSLGQEAILSAFEGGADGVMVLTCHDDNCHSRTGNRLARSRAEHARLFLERCGLAGRLTHHTVAANMEAELGRALSEFAARLTAAGRAERQGNG